MLIRICYNADSDPVSNDRPERNLVIQCLHGKYYIFCFHFSVTIRLFVIIILRKKNKLTALLSTGSGSTSCIRIRIHIIVSNPAAVPVYLPMPDAAFWLERVEPEPLPGVATVLDQPQSAAPVALTATVNNTKHIFSKCRYTLYPVVTGTGMLNKM